MVVNISTRVAVFYGAEDKTSAPLYDLVNRGLDMINGEIVHEIKYSELFAVEKLIEEAGIDYVFFCEKPDIYMNVVSRLFQTRIKAVLDVKTLYFIDNSFLNKDAMNKVLEAQWDSYFHTNDLLQEGNRVAIYHMSLDPVRTSCIDTNLQILRAFADEKGWEVVDEYLDLTNAVTKKSEFKRMMEDIDKYDIILLKYCYYISRKTNEYVKFRNAMFEKKKAIYSLNEGWC